LLIRFAYEASFSEDSKGGGRESNIKLLPVMVQMGLFFLDQNVNPQRKIYEKQLSQFLVLTDPKLLISSCTTLDNVTYMIVLSLFLQSLDEWVNCKFLFIKRAIQFAKVLSQSEFAILGIKRDLKKEELETDPIKKLFLQSRPLLIFISFVDKLQKLFKKKFTSTQTVSSSSLEISHQPEEEWVLDMFTNLRQNLDQIQTKCEKEVLKNYQSDLILADFQEFFDATDILKNVLAEAKTCQDFITNCISNLDEKL